MHNKTLVGRLLGKWPLQKRRGKSEDNSKETGYDGGKWMEPA
jgi:hypothetical protein